MNINQREIKLQQWVYVGGPVALRTFATANLLVLGNCENLVTRILGGLQYGGHSHSQRESLEAQGPTLCFFCLDDLDKKSIGML